MSDRWTRALKEGARGATLALIILILIGAFGGGAIARPLGVPPLLFSTAILAVAALGSLPPAPTASGATTTAKTRRPLHPAPERQTAPGSSDSRTTAGSVSRIR